MSTVQNSTSGVDLSTLLQAASGSSGSPASSTASATNAAASQMSASNFLQLLVTQLQNQDPLNPMDNAEVTTQLAQINTVEGIGTLNTTLSSLAASYAATQSMQATSLLGQGVLVDGSSLALSGGKATGGVSVSGPADDVVVSVTDATGNVLQQIDLGPQSAAGVVNFNWDGSTANGGTAADGQYSFTVAAKQGGNAVAASPLAYGRITAVAPAATGATVTVGNLGSVALSAVKQVVQ